MPHTHTPKHTRFSLLLNSSLKMTYHKDEGPILELHFHSGIDLPKAPCSSKSRPYVMADIVRRDSKPNWDETSMSSIDKEGGENPNWDFVIQFPLNQEKLHMATNFHLTCKIMHFGTLLRDRKIGYVTVGLPVLLAAGECITDSYPVVSAGKEDKGRIVISHKLVRDISAPPIEFYVPYSLSQFQDDHNPILELVFHHGIDLPHPYLSHKHKGRPYIEAAIDRSDTKPKPNWVKTVTDKNGGENPVWDYMIHFPLNQEMVRLERNFNLFCNIMHSGKKLGDRQIGKVKVCLQAFLAGAATGENIIYPVEASDGGKKGKIVVSHRLLTNTAGISAPPPVGVQDPNHGAEPNAVDGIRLAARVTTIAAAIINVVAELT